MKSPLKWQHQAGKKIKGLLESLVKVKLMTIIISSLLMRHIIIFADDGSQNGDDVETERSFVCRMKCILNTSAGFFKVCQ